MLVLAAPGGTGNRAIVSPLVHPETPIYVARPIRCRNLSTSHVDGRRCTVIWKGHGFDLERHTFEGYFYLFPCFVEFWTILYCVCVVDHPGHKLVCYAVAIAILVLP